VWRKWERGKLPGDDIRRRKEERKKKKKI